MERATKTQHGDNVCSFSLQSFCALQCMGRDECTYFTYSEDQPTACHLHKRITRTSTVNATQGTVTFLRCMIIITILITISIIVIIFNAMITILFLIFSLLFLLSLLLLTVALLFIAFIIANPARTTSTEFAERRVIAHYPYISGSILWKNARVDLNNNVKALNIQSPEDCHLLCLAHNGEKCKIFR